MYNTSSSSCRKGYFFNTSDIPLDVPKSSRRIAKERLTNSSTTFLLIDVFLYSAHIILLCLSKDVASSPNDHDDIMYKLKLHVPGGTLGVSKVVVSPDVTEVFLGLVEVGDNCCSSCLSLGFFTLLNSLNRFLRPQTIAPYDYIKR